MRSSGAQFHLSAQFQKMVTFHTLQAALPGLEQHKKRASAQPHESERKNERERRAELFIENRLATSRVAMCHLMRHATTWSLQWI